MKRVKNTKHNRVLDKIKLTIYINAPPFKKKVSNINFGKKAKYEKICKAKKEAKYENIKS